MAKNPDNTIEPIDATFEELGAAMVLPETDPANPDEIQVPKATHQGQMTVGDLILDCYVLEDGRRVFHKRGMAKALGMKSGGGNVFLRAMKRKSLGSHLNETLLEKIENPINFKPLTRDLAHGYDAEILAGIAKAIVDAGNAGDLTKAQESLAAQARIIQNAFAKVGVVALIDEATGYQQIRDPGVLRLLVQQYIQEEERQWEKQFPDAYYDDLNKLYGSKQYTKNKFGVLKQNRPQHFAGFTRSYIYEPLENGRVLEELDRVNPKIDKKGTRKNKFHQNLTPDYGIEKLKRQVQDVMTLISVSDNVSQFKKLFKKRFPEKGSQIDLL